MFARRNPTVMFWKSVTVWWHVALSIKKRIFFFLLFCNSEFQSFSQGKKDVIVTHAFLFARCTIGKLLTFRFLKHLVSLERIIPFHLHYRCPPNCIEKALREVDLSVKHVNTILFSMKFFKFDGTTNLPPTEPTICRTEIVMIHFHSNCWALNHSSSPLQTTC